MSAATAVSSFQFPVSSEQVSRFAFHVSRGGVLQERELVVPASRLGDRPAAATVLTGIESLDALSGGLPRGGLTEICGPASSGRTSVLLAVMSKMTGQGEVCALVDAGDCFDPKSAEAAGVELKRLLWVRCSKHRGIGRSGDGVKQSMPPSTALGAGLGRWSGASGQWPVASGQKKVNHKSQMDSLEQALKATDLLLQGGGFGLVVVDLGDVPTEAARRVPLTSWFRFRRAMENTRTALLVIEQEPHAKTCASLVMQLSAIGRRLSASGQGSVSSGQTQKESVHGRILSGLEIRAEILRSAAQQKKPVQSAGARFASRAQWAKVQSQTG